MLPHCMLSASEDLSDLTGVPMYSSLEAWVSTSNHGKTRVHVHVCIALFTSLCLTPQSPYRLPFPVILTLTLTLSLPSSPHPHPHPHLIFTTLTSPYRLPFPVILTLTLTLSLPSSPHPHPHPHLIFTTLTSPSLALYLTLTLILISGKQCRNDSNAPSKTADVPSSTTEVPPYTSEVHEVISKVHLPSPGQRQLVSEDSRSPAAFSTDDATDSSSAHGHSTPV